MAHQTGIHGESGWGADRGSAAPVLRVRSLHPSLPCTLRGSFLFSFAAVSPWDGHVLRENRLLYIAGSGCTWMHTARVEVSCVPNWGRIACVYWSGYFCSCLEVGCTRMCTSGKVYMHVHMFSVYSPVCAHLDETWLCLSRLLRVHALVAGFGHSRFHLRHQCFLAACTQTVGVCMCAQFRHISICVC